VITCLTSERTEDSFPKYADWEACASLFVAIDILTNIDGIRHSGFEGEPEETVRGLLILVACALQYMHKKGTTDPNTDSATLEELPKSFSFGEIQKRTLQTRFCSVLCETVNDKDALLSFGGLILPFGSMTLFLTFYQPWMTPSALLSLRRSDSRCAVTRPCFTPGAYFSS
jgi:hypothetical protein